LSEIKNKQLHAVLVGNPNAGKSSLFNSLTGLNQKTGNYSGVTVDKYEGKYTVRNKHEDETVLLTDLPGIYSLNPGTPDEKVAVDNLLSAENENVTCIIVIDASNIKRGLMLATQVLDLKKPSVIAINMIDEAKEQNIDIDIAELSRTLDTRVIAVSSKDKEGIDELKAAISKAKISSGIFYDLKENSPKDLNYSAKVKKTLSEKEDNDFFTKDHIYRHTTVNLLYTKCVKSPGELLMQKASRRIDKVLTHKVYGYLFFLLILAVIFQFIFFIAEYPMSWIEGIFISLRSFVASSLPQGILNDLLVNGVLAGISGVIMFVPQIALLFFFIAILEDSGYMARAGFIMDKIMRKFGLNGRSVIPLIGGTACAVPSVMAARSISNYKERLITVFVLPLVSCSARLPVYTLLISILFPTNSYFGILGAKGSALLFLYLLGFFMTFITAFILNKILPNTKRSFYVMELPVYRFPQMRNVFTMVFNKVKVFVIDAGKIILCISIILWFLANNGSGKQFADIQTKLTNSKSISESEIQNLNAQKLGFSYMGMIGHAIEPVIRPLGFDWKIGIALVTSFAAREVFVGSMATIYGSNEKNEKIREKLKTEKKENGSPSFTPAVCWSLLIFYAFALQCMSTIATVKRETGGWKWAFIQFAFMSFLAYAAAFTAFHLLS
jgi:ferrous iron transport protein B